MIPEPEDLPDLEPAGNTFRGEGAGIRAGVGRDATGACACPSPRTARRRSRHRLDTSLTMLLLGAVARPAAGGSAADECLGAWRVDGAPGSLGNVSVVVPRRRSVLRRRRRPPTAPVASGRVLPERAGLCAGRARAPSRSAARRAPAIAGAGGGAVVSGRGADVCTAPADRSARSAARTRRCAAVAGPGAATRHRAQRRRSAAGRPARAPRRRRAVVVTHRLRDRRARDGRRRVRRGAWRTPTPPIHSDAVVRVTGGMVVRPEPLPRRQRPAARSRTGFARASSARRAPARIRTTSSWSRRDKAYVTRYDRPSCGSSIRRVAAAAASAAASIDLSRVRRRRRPARDGPDGARRTAALRHACSASTARRGFAPDRPEPRSS